MKPNRPPSWLLAIALTATLVSAAPAEEAASTIKFSNPGQPGTVKVNLGRGDLRVQGSDTSEISVRSDAKTTPPRPRKDGLRVISTSTSFALKESDNVVTIDANAHDRGRGSDFRLTVPRNSTVIVQSPWGGNITCADVAGDIEISSVQGEIRLDGVTGGVVCSTMNGQIRANIRELREGKPLSFTSMNGEVILRVPPEAKANIRFRTQSGSVLTDFEESALVTKTEATAGHGKRGPNMWGGKVLNGEVQDAIREAAQIGAAAVREALEAVKEGLEAARIDNDEARRELDEAKRDLERARRDAERARRESQVGRTPGVGPAPPNAPAAPAAPGAGKPPAIPGSPKPMPTISGGKLVTGTLNGGGPEISVSTMNGDITFRKVEQK